MLLRLLLLVAYAAAAATAAAEPEPRMLVDPESSTAAVKFNPLPVANEPFLEHPIRFFVYGDTHAGYAPAATVHWSILYRAIAFNPGFILHLGDLIHGQTNDPEAHWRLFDDSSGILVRAYEFYPTLGNHDVRNGFYVHYFDYFADLPGASDNISYYAIEKPDLILVVLDVDSSNQGSNYASFAEQAAFVEQTILDHPDKSYRFVTFHMPPYTSGIRGANFWARAFHPIFRDLEISAVFCGHTHAYERFLVDGIHYVVAGGAGGVPHALNASEHYIPGTRQCAAETYNYITVEGGPEQLVATASSPDGTVVDEFLIMGHRRLFARRDAPIRDAPVRDAADHVALGLASSDAATDGIALRYELPEQGVVTLTVHDVRGRRVRTLAGGLSAAGVHRITWDGRDDSGAPAACGLYLVRLSTARGAPPAVKAMLRR